jgi:hypothetical protein
LNRANTLRRIPTIIPANKTKIVHNALFPYFYLIGRCLLAGRLANNRAFYRLRWRWQVRAIRA